VNVGFLMWLAGWRLMSWNWNDKWVAVWGGRRYVLREFDALDALLTHEEGFRHGSYDD
jgi:hypothetical protein